MTAAYFTARETWRKLHLPDDLGRLAWAMWQMQPSFPKPVAWARDRWFFPQVEQWLMAHHGVSAQTIMDSVSIPLSGSKGEDFDGWRKAKTARRSKRAGPGLPPPPAMDDVLVATVRPEEARVSGQDSQVVAFRPRPVPAE